MAQATDLRERAHLSHFTGVHGNEVWQVMYRGMPICREQDSFEAAWEHYQKLYAEQRGAILERPMVWTDGERWESIPLGTLREQEGRR